MKIDLNEKNGIKIITLSGKIMGAPGDEKFTEAVTDFAEHGFIKVVLDLSQVDWMNSKGLGMCVRALTTLRKQNGELKLANLSNNSRSLMEKCRLLNVFSHYKTVDKAIESFK